MSEAHKLEAITDFILLSKRDGERKKEIDIISIFFTAYHSMMLLPEFVKISFKKVWDLLIS